VTYVRQPAPHRVAIAGLAIALASITGAVATSGTAGASAPIGATATDQRLREDDPLAAQATAALGLLRSSGETGWSTYTVARNAIADVVAQRVGADQGELRRAWSRADLAHQVALMAGLTQLGVPYRRNTSKPGEGMDCSGLTTYAWAQAGIELPRTSWQQIRVGALRTFDSAQAGDIMWYPGHVMLWLGVGHATLEAPQPGKVVDVEDGPSTRWLKIADPTG
jgi:cell wall-associated NlpC family hydrolase